MISKQTFLENFHDTYYYKKLKELYNCDVVTADTINALTPRARLLYPMFVADIFYYIDMIIDSNTKILYDIGCGENLFKDILEEKCEVFGLDPWKIEDSDLDITFEIFATIHKNTIKNAMAINSLHFDTIDQIFLNKIPLFFSMLKKGGKGLITLNYNMIQMNDKFATMEKVEKEINILKNRFIKKVKFLLIETQPCLKVASEEIDGNIKLCFEIIEEWE